MAFRDVSPGARGMFEMAAAPVNAFMDGQQNARRNTLAGLQAQQMQRELDDDAEWDAAYARKDWDTLMRLDPQATEVLRAHEQQKAMAGLEPISISRQPIDMNELQRTQMDERKFAAEQQYRKQQMGLQWAQERRLSQPQPNGDEEFARYQAMTPEQRDLYDRMKGRKAEGTSPLDGMNDRQRSGINMQRDAAITYAANVTGMPRDEVESILNQSGPDGIANLINERGGRMLQGATARVVQSLPMGKTLVEATNADLLAPAKSGGAGIAMTQNPTGPITTPDFQAGEAQFPSPVYPLNVQAEMVRQMLKQSEAGKQPAAAAAQAGGRAKVRSVQEAAKLPPGTEFETPDGQIRVRK